MESRWRGGRDLQATPASGLALTGVVSLALWLAALFLGRWIAFV
jgi:hypothetical protein